MRYRNVYFLLLTLFVFAVSPSAAQKPKGKTAAQKQKTSESKTNPNIATTAAETSFLSALEIAVIDEINQARDNPQKFAGYLEEYKKALKGNVVYLPNQTGTILIEGAAVIDDALDDLRKTPKVDALSISRGVFKAANLQLADLKVNSSLSHKGKDGSDVEMRLFRFGMPGINIAENICYKVATAREVVMTMILDDGVKSRSHRKNVFSPKFKKIGVACGVSNQNESICVAVFTDAFTDRK